MTTTMTSGLVAVVEATVDDHIQSGQMFTAHDITLAVRGKGHKAPHNDVRDAVHDYYSRGGMGIAYTRSNISVPGGNPILYHQSTDDPLSYSNVRGAVQPVQNNTISIPANLTAPVSAPASDDNDNDNDDDDEDDFSGVLVGGTNLNAVSQSSLTVAAPTKPHKKGNFLKNNDRVVDSRQVLSIPSALIRAAGLNPRQVVYVYVGDNPGEIEISSNVPDVGKSFKTYTVDDGYQVRLTQSCLKWAGIGGTSYDVVGNQSKIFVKRHF